MGEKAFEIPLFPLDVVLFPGMTLPMHIFERRYREMMRHCLDSNISFGVVLAHEPNPAAASDDEAQDEMLARVGTIARINDYERLPDGCYNLLATGAERFEILELRPGKPYSIGLVRVLRDDADFADPTRLAALTSDARSALRTYLRTMLRLLGSGDCRIPIPRDPTELSYVIGMCLTCEDFEKQVLLETRSLDQRLAHGTQMLRQETMALARQIECEADTNAPSDRARLN